MLRVWQVLECIIRDKEEPHTNVWAAIRNDSTHSVSNTILIAIVSLSLSHWDYWWMHDRCKAEVNMGAIGITGGSMTDAKLK